MHAQDPELSSLGADRTGAESPFDLESADELARLLAQADTPFRAWAAAALMSAAKSRHRAEGRQLATELADMLPGIADLQHADLAGYALLDGMAFLTPMEQERVRAAMPRPYPERGRRSRLYDSSVYVYLLARGIGPTLTWAEDLLRYTDDELVRVTEHIPDIIELALLFAARLEMARMSPVAEDTIRRVRGRLAGAPDDPEAAMAIRWLLEFYCDHWLAGPEGGALEQVARSYVEQSAGQVRTSTGKRPTLVAMQLELATRPRPLYHLTTEAEEDSRISKRLGRHRWGAAVAYALLIAVVAGGPVRYAAEAELISTRIAWAGAVGWGLPASVWAALSVLGRARDVRTLGAATTLGLMYWTSALISGWMGYTDCLEFLGGNAAFLELLLASVAAMWAAAHTARRTP